jgi:hypothetical protein
MNADIQSQLDVIRAPAQAQLDAANAIPALVDVAELAKFNEGFQAGKDSIQLPDPNSPDAIYSQSQMDAAVIAGKGQQLSEDQVIIDAGLAREVDLQAQLDAKSLEVQDLRERVSKAFADVKTVEADLTF